MSEKDKNSLPLIFLIFLVVIFVAAGFAIYQYWNYFCNGHISCSLLTPTKIGQTEINSISNLQYWGQTGDFFGGVLNPFLTFIGLVFVIMTIKQNEKALKQNQDALKLSETELKLSRDELKKSTEALQSQVKTAELQRFENTFFQLIQLHNEITDSVKAGELQGRYAIKKLLDILKNSYNDTNIFFRGYDENIGNYFRNFYQLLKFIDESSIDDKIFYANLLQVQLSNDEINLLFFNCVSKQGVKLKPLAEKYNFFKHLPLQDEKTKALANNFKPTAFSESEQLNNSFIRIQNLNKENDSLKSKIQVLESDTRKSLLYQEKIKNLTQENESLKSEIQSSKSTCVGQKNILSNLKEKLLATEEKIKHFENSSQEKYESLIFELNRKISNIELLENAYSKKFGEAEIKKVRETIKSEHNICPRCNGDGGLNCGCQKCDGTGWVTTETVIEKLVVNLK